MKKKIYEVEDEIGRKINRYVRQQKEELGIKLFDIYFMDFDPEGFSFAFNSKSMTINDLDLVQDQLNSLKELIRKVDFMIEVKSKEFFD